MRLQVGTNAQAILLMKHSEPKKQQPEGSVCSTQCSSGGHDPDAISETHIFWIREITLLETSGVWPASGPTLGQQWTGKWEGREVTVRTFNPKTEEHQKVSTRKTGKPLDHTHAVIGGPPTMGILPG